MFRQVYPPEGGSIEVLGIACTPQPCESRVDVIPGGYELVGVLPRPMPERISFVISYDYKRGVKVYNDVSELHYKIWGEEWDKPLKDLTVTIRMPVDVDSNVLHWFHPQSFVKDEKIIGNSIAIETYGVPSHNWFETRVAYPRIPSPDPSLVRIINEPGLEKIKKIEQGYLNKQKRANVLFIFVWVIFMGSIATPFYIYFKFGREPEIDYHALYEREPPSDSKPAAVNAILQGSIGAPDLNAFLATIMDLVYRGLVEIRDVKTEKSYLGIFSRSTEDVELKLKNKGEKELAD